MLPLIWAHEVAGSAGVWTVALLGLAFCMAFFLLKMLGASERS